MSTARARTRTTSSRPRPAAGTAPKPPPAAPAGPAVPVTQIVREVRYVEREPQETRLCAICQARRPIGAMAPFGTALACVDIDGCDQRAHASNLYPMVEDELALAQHAVAQGAIRREDPEAERIREDTAGVTRAARVEGALSVT